MKKKVLTVTPQNCTGCRMCELACSSFKEQQFIPGRARVRVIHNLLEGNSSPTICLQCEDAMCMAACPEAAIAKSETTAGDPIIAVDAKKCIGCHRCVAACPFGAMSFFKGSMATKCDLCDGAPKCAEFCFYDCIKLVELSEEDYAKRSKKVKALTIKACRKISEKEPHRRRHAFCKDVGGVSLPRENPESAK